jgi:hypothetical protein
VAFTGNFFCTSAKVGFFTGTYTPLTDTMKIALYTNLATLDATTTVYSAANEVVGTGYTAGGNTLTGKAISFSGTTVWLTFSSTSWTASTIVARGALIYDSTRANAAIAVLDFSSDKTATANTFTIQMPTAAAGTALIRIV